MEIATPAEVVERVKALKANPVRQETTWLKMDLWFVDRSTKVPRLMKGALVEVVVVGQHNGQPEILFVDPASGTHRIVDADKILELKCPN